MSTSQSTPSPGNSVDSSPISYPSDLDTSSPPPSVPNNDSQAVEGPLDTAETAHPSPSRESAVAGSPDHRWTFEPPKNFREVWNSSNWGRAFASDGPNYHGWGDPPAPPSPKTAQLQCIWERHKHQWKTTGSQVHELNVAHYSRANDFGWSWEGTEGRDTSLDNLPSRAWSTVQLHRSLKEAAAVSIPPPTFTGPQVVKRLQQVDRSIVANQGVREDIHTQLALLEERVRAAKGRQYELAAEAEDLRAVRSNLRDLFELGSTWRVPPPPLASADGEESGPIPQ
ncbi:hypothetical protein V5O48_013750 [Marasmius crinis-equi]|uniref:Uncharacterized protein n=1 Tax=Marasmius crinis-equi TaxID=585013 RepID=A0ABR3EZ74_9AGAR